MNFINKTNAYHLLAHAAGQFLILLMLEESIAPDYSMHENTVIDLGAITETELIFNTSWFFPGLLNFFTGFILFKVMGDKKLLIVFALGGVGAMGAGLVPLDNPTGVHGLFALFAFVFINLEAAVAGRLARSPLDKISIALAIMG